LIKIAFFKEDLDFSKFWSLTPDSVLGMVISGFFSGNGTSVSGEISSLSGGLSLLDFGGLILGGISSQKTILSFSSLGNFLIIQLITQSMKRNIRNCRSIIPYPWDCSPFLGSSSSAMLSLILVSA